MAKHWTDLPVHRTHTWAKNGHCQGCMMHIDWPGARDRCTQRVPKAAKTPRELIPKAKP